MNRIRRFLLLFLFFHALHGTCSAVALLDGPHFLFVGPEVYYAKRTKEGGSRQSGWLYGGHATYERRKPRSLYFCLDGYYASGDLNGATSSSRTLKSTLTDKEIEGRIGYAFCWDLWRRVTWIPYGGYGFFQGANHFKKPSPIVCNYRNSLEYACAGLDVSWRTHSCWEWGCDFTAKFVLEGKCKITRDPDYDTVHLMIENEMQYEFDLPIRYHTCWNKKNLTFQFTPFYRYRHYGGRMNWPFDFLDTQFQMYGARLMLNVIF